jgi:hypothetical protein
VPGFEPGTPGLEVNQKEASNPVEADKLDEFFALRKIEGISDKWLHLTRIFITNYLNYIKWKIEILYKINICYVYIFGYTLLIKMGIIICFFCLFLLY